MGTHLLISQAAKLLGVTPKTLRHYEELGLITPKRLENRYRLYSAGDLMRLKRIRRLQTLGLSLKEIRILLDQTDGEHLWSDVLQKLLIEVKTQIQALQERRQSIKRMLETGSIETMEQSQEPSPTVELANEKLGEYLSEVSPELWEQEKMLFGVLDCFQWTGEHNIGVNDLIAYLVDHPDIYREMLSLTERMAAIHQAPANSHEINQLAQELSTFVQSQPELLKRMKACAVLEEPQIDVLVELMAMNADISPAQEKLFATLSSMLDA